MQGIRETVSINDLNQQGLSVSAIAQQVGCDRKTVSTYIEQSLEARCNGPRAARSAVLDPYVTYLTKLVTAFADLSWRRLLGEIRKLGYEGSYLTLKPFLREVRPPVRTQFERRFETPPGQQAQVEFAAFSVAFTGEPGVTR